jgi:RNA polymerase sigma-70 factor (ECF subfamily)
LSAADQDNDPHPGVNHPVPIARIAPELYLGGMAETQDKAPGPPESGRAFEWDLVRSLQQRDPEAERAFLERYRPLLVHCIGRFGLSGPDREDLLQELFAHLFQQIYQDCYRPERGSLGSWLYRVAWCRCVDHRRRRSLPLDPGLQEPPEEEDPTPDPSASADAAEVASLVREALSRMNLEDAHLLQARFLQGRALTQLAGESGLSLDTVKYRLRKATERLRLRLMALREQPRVAE